MGHPISIFSRNWIPHRILNNIYVQCPLPMSSRFRNILIVYVLHFLWKNDSCIAQYIFDYHFMGNLQWRILDKELLYSSDNAYRVVTKKLKFYYKVIIRWAMQLSFSLKNSYISKTTRDRLHIKVVQNSL